MKQKLLFLLALSVFALWRCGPDPQREVAATTSASETLKDIVERFMAKRAEVDPYTAMSAGLAITQFPAGSLEEAQAIADFAASLRQDLDSIPVADLTHQEQLTRHMLREQLTFFIQGPRFYWLAFDVTPYQAGFMFSQLVPFAFASFTFTESSDAEAYLALARSLANRVNHAAEKLRGQQTREILLPKPAIPGVQALFGQIRNNLPAVLNVGDDRLEALPEDLRAQFKGDLSQLIESELLPAFDGVLGVFDEAYLQQAPEQVGLGQYPGGLDFYRALVRLHTTLDLTPDEIHERGLAYMEQLDAEMKAIRDSLSFTGSKQEFHDQLRADERFYAQSPEAVEAVFETYIKRVEPLVETYFSLLPKAPYGLKRLDPAAEAGMTFGFYQVPTTADPMGYYRYNGSKLDERSMIWAGPLIYHELVPGHHFQIALQREHEELPPYRKSGTFTGAFVEGWANYAAVLTLEMGLLDDPYERYGWLLFDSFITVRLVVDTGLNHREWTLERARDYMLANTFQSETEVASELLRYGTDMPGQALGYKLGMEKILEIRRATEARMGEAFDIRAFHAAVIGSGSLPLDRLENHVNHVLSLEN